jgi:AraC-like DNA-binding protein
VRLVGAIFINAKFTAPWCYQSPHADASATVLQPNAERIVIFHMITEGECFAQLDREEPTRLVAGDVVIFPQGDAHRMASDPGLKPAKADSARLERIFSERPRLLQYGGGGAVTRLVCGYLGCDARLVRMLMNGLPPLVHVNIRGASAGPWLEESVRYALREARSPRAGGEGVLSKLSEVLFIEVLRIYMEQQQEGRTGWLAGVNDRIVGSALKELHGSPAKEWTLEELARCSGTSRSVLAERFQALVGSSPMQYLTHWRMTLASNLLTRSNAPLSHIAEQVGYQTDTAFSRAFRREFGEPPAAWRKARVAAGPLREATA